MTSLAQPSETTLPTRAELVARAEAVVPLLAENSARAEADGRVPEEVMTALDEAGLLMLHVPREHGGSEADLNTAIDVMMTLSQGCSSTSWTASVINIAHWIVTLFPEQVRTEVFSTSEYSRCCGVLIPRKGFAVAVDGGYHVEDAAWGFGTGSQHASWSVFAIPVVNEAGEMVDQILAEVPFTDIIKKDDWNVSAMRATGSQSLALKDVFIPEHRTISAPAVLNGAAFNDTLQDRTLYRCAIAPTFALSPMAPIIGMAKYAVNQAIERIPGRTVPYTAINMSESSVVHMSVAQAQLKLDSAVLHAHRAADEIQRYAAAREVMPVEARAKAKADAGWAVQLAYEAGELAVSVCGGSSIAERDPLQRVMRDLRAGWMHGYVLPSTNIELLGRVLAGQPPHTLFV